MVLTLGGRGGGGSAKRVKSTVSNLERPRRQRSGVTRADGAELDGASELDELFRTFWTPLVRIAWMMCGSRDDAEDVVQDAFVRLATNKMSSPELPYAYLRKIVTNLIRDRKRRAVVALRTARAPVDSDPGLEEVGLWFDLQKLPLRQRQVLILRYFDDLPLSAIADELGCGIPTVKSLLYRALTTLRREVQRKRMSSVK